MSKIAELRSQTNAKEIDNSEHSEELIKREMIPNTPFMAVWTEETQWIGTLGKYRISQSYETQEELNQDVNMKNWDIMMAVMNVTILENQNK
jgi:hypothetical protein